MFFSDSRGSSCFLFLVNFAEIQTAMISIVVAKSTNHTIGNQNQLIWHLPNDLKHFKAITSGHPIIMGRKTFDSIGKALPNRTNIVITRNEGWHVEGVLVAHSLAEAIEKAQSIDEEIFIIGGGNIYAQAMELADVLEVTEVLESFEGDAFFPIIDPQIWREVSRENHASDEKHAYPYAFVRYERI